MKTNKIISPSLMSFLRTTFLAYFLAIITTVSAQEFSSGSDGSLGALIVTEDTALDMPPDGVFHYTTVTLDAGATLRFLRNTFNTPVYLLATGDVVINGTIDVSGSEGRQGLAGEGGPGGFEGGQPAASSTVQPGDGLGPGAGRGGINSFSSSAAATRAGGGSYSTMPNTSGDMNGATYGNSLLMPLIGGSGGGGMTGNPGIGGGGGGGAILVASDTSVFIGGTGVISSNGGSTTTSGAVGAGSGGAIRLVTPTVSGTGRMTVGPVSNFGGFGRIRIDALDRFAMNLIFTGTTTVGREMVVFPAIIPRLDIIELAGQSIAEGITTSVRVELDQGTSPNQTIVVQARDFTGTVSIDVVITPENGSSAVFPAEIDMTTGNPAQVTVDIIIPTGVTNQVHVWSR